MTVSGIEQFFTMEAVVTPFLGAGPAGDLYGPEETVAGFLDDGVVLEDTSRGEQLVARTKFYCALSAADLFSPESSVVVNGRTLQVNYVRRRDASGFGGPSHLEVDLS